MGKPRNKPNYRRRVLRLPDLDHCKAVVLNSLGSPASRRVYEYAIDQFIAWYCSEPRLAFNRIVVVRYRMYLESRRLAANTINQQLAAVRRLAHEAADSGLLSPELAAGISRVKGVKQLGFRAGNWLSAEQSSEVLRHALGETMRAKRDFAMLAMLFGCGFRRSELVGLELDEIQMRQGHWAVVDLIGKGGHIRTVPIPEWVKAALDQWTRAAGVMEGRIFRAVARAGKVWGKGISQNVVWYVVKSCCERAGLEHIAPHDLRRTWAKLCHSNGGELEQIQFLLGHASVQTTERYLGCKQNLGHPVNDLFDLRTDGRRSQENDDESDTVKASDPVEKASGQGVQCSHGGAEHDHPVCHSTHLKLIARTAFDAALGRELHEVIQEAKKMASQIQQSSDLWDLESYLTQRRKEINRKYDYRYSELTHVFGKLLHESRLSEEELRGLREDKLKAIRSCAKFLARTDAA
jgi:site-specific recombinase XerD